MKTLIAATAFALLLVAPGHAQEKPAQTFLIAQPTILAFFPPLTEADLEKSPDMNEALGDFQLYATRVGAPLRKAGVDFEVVSATRFRVKDGTTSRTFRTGKIGMGYYFIAPGKTPHIEFGVMTDDDILAMAAKYFNIPIRK